MSQKVSKKLTRNSSPRYARFRMTMAIILTLCFVFVFTVPPARAQGGAIGDLGKVAFGAGGAGGYFVGIVAEAVFRFATPIVGILMKILGGFMNWSMQITGSFIGKDGSMVSVGWEIMRDLVNVCFIFILLFISIATILGVGLKNYGMKKALAMVIVMALLVNFSKVFCEQLIQFSHLLTNFFLTQSGVTQGQLSEHIMSQLSVTKAFQASRNFGNNWLDAGVNVGIAGVMNLIVLVAVLIFLALGCLMLLIRVVALFALTIVSPVAFLCRAIPYKGAQALWQKWWQNLMNYVLFAPAFAFFVYLALLFPETIDKVKIASLTGGAKTTVDPGTMTVPTLGNQFFASADLLIKYAITLGLLFAGLYMAQHLSLQSGKTIVGWAKDGMEKSSKWIGKASLKGGGTFYRQTIGRGLKEGGQALSARGGKLGKVGDALQGAGVISMPYAKRKAMGLAEKTPILGKALGGRGAYAAKRKSEINKQAGKLKNRSKDDLQKMFRGFLGKLPKAATTDEDLKEAAAALKAFVDKGGQLEGKDKKYVEIYKRAGGDLMDIVSKRPDWIEDLAPEYVEKNEKEIDQIAEEIPEENLRKELKWQRPRLTPQEIEAAVEQEKRRMTEQGTWQAKVKDARNISIIQHFYENTKPNDFKQQNASILDQEDVEQAILGALKKNKITKKHIAKLFASDNEKLITKITKLMEENRDDLPEELQDYWNSNAAQLAMVLGKEISEVVSEEEEEEGEEGEEE